MANKMSFAEWMKAVDAACCAKCGLSCWDLDDFCYRDLYDDGVSAKSAAAKAIKNAKANSGY